MAEAKVISKGAYTKGGYLARRAEKTIVTKPSTPTIAVSAGLAQKIKESGIEKQVTTGRTILVQGVRSAGTDDKRLRTLQETKLEELRATTGQERIGRVPVEEKPKQALGFYQYQAKGQKPIASITQPKTTAEAIDIRTGKPFGVISAYEKPAWTKDFFGRLQLEISRKEIPEEYMAKEGSMKWYGQKVQSFVFGGLGGLVSIPAMIYQPQKTARGVYTLATDKFARQQYLTGISERMYFQPSAAAGEFAAVTAVSAGLGKAVAFKAPTATARTLFLESGERGVMATKIKVSGVAKPKTFATIYVKEATTIKPPFATTAGKAVTFGVKQLKEGWKSKPFGTLAEFKVISREQFKIGETTRGTALALQKPIKVITRTGRSILPSLSKPTKAAMIYEATPVARGTLVKEIGMTKKGVEFRQAGIIYERPEAKIDTFGIKVGRATGRRPSRPLITKPVVQQKEVGVLLAKPITRSLKQEALRSRIQTLEVRQAALQTIPYLSVAARQTTKLELMPRTKQLQRSVVAQMPATQQKAIIGTIPSIIPIQIATPITGTRTITTTRPPTITTIITPPIAPPIIAPPIPAVIPPMIPFAMGGAGTFGISTSILGKQAKRYTPSLTAIALNIRGKAPKGLTGIEIRPILSSRSKKKSIKRRRR